MSEWPRETPMVIRESSGRLRNRVYVRKATDTPGRTERNRQRGEGAAWCRRCAGWLPVADVRSGLCREHRNEMYRENYAASPAAIRARTQARKRNLQPIPIWWREEKLTARCAYGCGRPADQLDHVWPVKLGGRSVPGNLVPACSTCNNQKRAQHPAPWVDRGLAAKPDLWLDFVALALEHGSDEWLEAA